MRIGITQIKGALLYFFIGKKCPIISVPDATFNF